jgi:hypothetical protein
VPLVAVVRRHDAGSYVLQFFVLRQWEAKIGVASQREADEIATFLEDLRFQNSDQHPIASLFQRLSNLSVGPIRAFASGSCAVEDLNEVIQKYFEIVSGSSSWQEHFDNLS